MTTRKHLASFWPYYVSLAVVLFFLSQTVFLIVQHFQIAKLFAVTIVATATCAFLAVELFIWFGRTTKPAIAGVLFCIFALFARAVSLALVGRAIGWQDGVFLLSAGDLTRMFLGRLLSVDWIPILRLASVAKPSKWELSLRLADAYRRKHKFNIATQINEHARLIECPPNVADFQLTKILVSEHNFIEAKPILDRLSMSGFSDRALSHYLGVCQYFLGLFDQAIDSLTLALQTNPKADNSFTYRALAFTEVGNLQQAVDDYTKALAIVDGVSNTYYNRGLCYLSLGESDLAKADFLRATRCKMPANAFFQLAEIASAEGNDLEARHYSKKARRMNKALGKSPMHS